MSIFIECYLSALMVLSFCLVASLVYLHIHAKHVKAVRERYTIIGNMIVKWYWIILAVMAVLGLGIMFIAF